MTLKARHVTYSTTKHGIHDDDSLLPSPKRCPAGEYASQLGKTLPPVFSARGDLPEQLDQCLRRLRGAAECFSGTTWHKQG